MRRRPSRSGSDTPSCWSPVMTEPYSKAGGVRSTLPPCDAGSSPPEHRLQPRIERAARRHHHAAERPHRDQQVLDDARAAAELLLADMLTKGPRHAVGERIRLAAAGHDLR